MKKINWLLLLMIVAGSATFSVSCKNKKAETTLEDKSTNSNVEISSDETLRTNVNNLVKSYDGVSAEVKDGVVTLRGNVKQEDLQPLIMKVQELKPKKVENQLVIKS